MNSPLEIGVEGHAEIALGLWESSAEKWVINGRVGDGIIMYCGPVCQRMTLDQLAQFTVALANVGKFVARKMAEKGVEQPHCVEADPNAVTQNAAVTGHCP